MTAPPPAATTDSPFAESARLVASLKRALDELEPLVRPLRLAPLDRREWYRLLVEKLIPQLTAEAWLVVAVVGGTNIGKSVVFNHIAGFRASASSPLAAGTKHPVCLIPEGFETRHDLGEIFPGFTLTPWLDSQQALQDDAAHRLFWRTHAGSPPNLLILDTPDVDSDAPINWQRADMVRRCADVLVAVLTQQKYNDAAVKEFFRKAAAEGKIVIVIFNQLLLPDDEPYWPLWLNTFTKETGVRPELVYLAGNDRKAAEAVTLTFQRRHFEGESPAPAETELSEVRLMDVLSRFHFAEIKLHTLRGALDQLTDPAGGGPSYLAEVERAAGLFEAAARHLSQQSLASDEVWPTLTTRPVIDEVRAWWQDQRTGWTASVHNTYRTVGQAIFWPVQKVRERLQGPAEDPLETYRQQEWEAVVRTVGAVYHKLQIISETGDVVLRTQMKAILDGHSREEFLGRLRTQQAGTDYRAVLREVVRKELQSLQSDNPRMHQFLTWADTAAAAVRPAASIALFVGGMGPLGHAAGEAITQAALHFAVDIGQGAATVVVGEAAIEKVGQGQNWLQAKLLRLHAGFTQQRLEWLGRMLEQELLGDLLGELRRVADLPASPAFRETRELFDRLARERTT